MDKLTVKFKFEVPKTRKRKNEERKISKNKDPTGNARQKRFRIKWKNNELMREKNVKKCAEFRKKLKVERTKNNKLDEQIKKKERERKAAYRKKQKEAKLRKEATISNFDKEKHGNKGQEKNSVNSRINENDAATIAKLKQKVKNLQQFKRRKANEKSKVATVVSPEALRKRASRVKRNLPSSPKKWAHTLSHVLRNASPRKKEAFKAISSKGRKIAAREKSNSTKRRQFWKKEVSKFLMRDDISRQMPNKKDVIKVDGNLVAKRHLLLGKKEVYLKFREENINYPYRYTTFAKCIPKQIKRMNVNDRRVCVCLKCFNMTEMLSSINQVKHKDMEPITIRRIYKESICETSDQFPALTCIEGNCAKCANKLKKKYEGMINENRDKVLKYAQWELVNQKYITSKGQEMNKKVWQQVTYKENISAIFDKLGPKVNDIKGHVFRNEYQYYQHRKLAENLPEDQAIVYADFSQNYALKENDEIQAAHYTKHQVTLHTMYLIRHSKSSTLENRQLTREALAIVSDDLKHSTSAVYNFTLKLLSYMRDNPQKVGIPKVLHRITDNCGFEYKCNQAFSHLNHYQEVMGVKMVYHYSEPGHGKGPHDGIGATIKHGLDMLIVQDRVRLRNAYDVYLAAVKHLGEVARDADPSKKKLYEFSKRAILYVPARCYQSTPKLDTKAVKGTLNLRVIHSVSKDEVEVSNLSCSCPACIYVAEGHCLYQKWKQTSTQRITKLPSKNEANNEINPCILLLLYYIYSTLYINVCLLYHFGHFMFYC